MKKKRLLELLAELPDNADIRLWNGMVGDWMDIDAIVPTHVVKMSTDHFVEGCRLEECTRHNDWNFQLPVEEVAALQKSARQADWELNDYVTEEDIKEGRWKHKVIYLFQARARNKSTWDRLGTMSY